MRHSPFDVPYGRTKYPNQQEEDDDEYFKNYLRDIEDQYLGAKKSKSKDLYKKSRPSKKKHRQRFNDQQKYFPWDDRFRGKSKLNEDNKKNSQKQKIKLQHKNINYDLIFRELSYGNSTDVVTAAMIYKQILQSLVFYIMEKQLEMQVINNYKENNGIQKKNEQKQENSPTKMKNNLEDDNSIILQLSIASKEQETNNEAQKQQEAKEKLGKNISEQKQAILFQEDKKFFEEFDKFKRVSSSNGIIAMIPYKTIPSLLLIQSLNFIIEKTSQQSIKKYFQVEDKLFYVYSEMNKIAKNSKQYLLSEKLKKGLRYIDQVENKLNRIYQKNASKPKSTDNKISENTIETAKKDGFSSELEERKVSSIRQNTANSEQRKEDYSKASQKDK